MALPASWALIPVTGTYTDLDGIPASGRVYYTSKQVVTIGGETIVPLSQWVDLVDGAIPAGFKLPSTNDPGLNVTGWAYTVVEEVGRYSRAPYAIFVPYDSTGIDMAAVSPVVPPPELVSTQGLSAYQVAVVNGYVGTQEEWLASLVGPPGPSGSQSFNLVAATALDYPRVVAADAQGQAYYPDLSVPQDVLNIVGVTTNSAAQGAQVPIISAGEIAEGLWTWAEGIIYCSETGGQLTQTPASSAFVPVAKALGPTALFVSLQTSIQRA